MDYQLVSGDNYSIFKRQLHNTDYGAMLLPEVWQDSLWGVLCYHDGQLIAGWVGTKRIANKCIGSIYQEVSFDSLPSVFDKAYREDEFIDNVRSFAKRSDISSICVSHWSRGLMNMEHKCATFIINLCREDLFGGVESKQRNIIRKGEKSGVNCKIISSKEDMLSYMDVFQRLRRDTQLRAIANNGNASMLLKSDSFFKNIFSNYDVCLGIAEIEGAAAAAALAMVSGRTMYYYSGGSDIDLNRKSGASALLIWKMIEYAKVKGLKFFDMGGVPVNPDDSHPAYGVYQFKRSFGGQYCEFSCGDMIISKFKYKLVSLLKRNRKLLRVVSSKM